MVVVVNKIHLFLYNIYNDNESKSFVQNNDILRLNFFQVNDI